MSEVTEIINIVLYCLLGVFGFFGFLSGVSKGFNKAFLRLFVFAIFVLVALLLTQLTAKFALSIQLPLGQSGENITLWQYLKSFFADIEILQSLANSSPALESLIIQLPFIVANLVIFEVLLWIMTFVGFIIYLILASIAFKDEKVSKPKKSKDKQLQVEIKKNKVKKFRLLGGIVGAVQGILMIVLTFVPVNAIVSMYKDISMSTQNNVVYATTEKTPTAKLLDKNIPEESKEILNSIIEHPFYKISSFSGADKVIFDAITSTKINGEKIVLRKEINNLAIIYDNISFLFDENFNLIEITNYQEQIDFDKLQTAIDTMFSSGMFRVVVPEIISWGLEEIQKPDNVFQVWLEPSAVRLFKTYQTQLSLQPNIISSLQADINSIFAVAKSLTKSGLVDELINTQAIDYNEVLTIVLANERKLINDVFENIVASPTIQVAITEGLNYLIDLANEYKPAELQPVKYVDISKVSWNTVDDDLLAIINGLLDVYIHVEQKVEDGVFDAINTNLKDFTDVDFEYVLTKLGNVLTRIQVSNLLVDENGKKSIYNSLIDIANSTEINKYINLSVFKQSNAWNTELGKIGSALKIVQKANLFDEFLTETGEFNQTINVNRILDKLTAIDANNKTYLHNILTYIFETNSVKNAIVLGLNELNSMLKEYETSYNVTLDLIQTSAFDLPIERQLIANAVDDLANYAKQLDFETIDENALKQILTSRISLLGRALNTLKESQLLGPYTKEGVNHDGVYVSVIKFLAENQDINQFIDLQIALEPNFDWEFEAYLVEVALDSMKSINIKVNGATKSLIDAIIDGDNLSSIVDSITPQNVESLINPIASSRLLSKNLVTIINAVNSQISNIFNTNIEEIDANTNILAQKNDIVDVFVKLFELYPSIKDGFDSNKLSENAILIGKILNLMKQNAYRTGDKGVFADAYIAIVDYLKADSVYGQTLSDLLNEYESPEHIDWVQIIDVAVEASALSGGQITDELKQKIALLVADLYRNDEYIFIVDTIIDIANEFLTIDNTTSNQDLTNLTIWALTQLAENQTNAELPNEYPAKVDRFLNLLEKLTGISEINILTGITNYNAEKQALENIENLLNVVSGEEVEIKDIENLILALPESQILLPLMEQNNININVGTELENYISNFIDENFTDSNLIQTLKTVFNLI